MLGLVAVYVFYRAAELYLGRPDRRVLYVLAFVSSILFWSSILGKDPIVLLGVALYTYGFVAWYRARRLRYVAVLLFGVLLAAAMKLVRQYTTLASLQEVMDTADALARALAMGGSGEEPAQPLTSVGSVVTFL